MSRVRWTTDAAGDLQHIVEHIRTDNPTAARNVARTIFDGCRSLRDFPHRGRIGLVADTRELVFAPWPYIAVYEVIEDEVQVLRIRHTSQDWP